MRVLLSSALLLWIVHSSTSPLNLHVSRVGTHTSTHCACTQACADAHSHAAPQTLQHTAHSPQTISSNALLQRHPRKVLLSRSLACKHRHLLPLFKDPRKSSARHGQKEMPRCEQKGGRTGEGGGRREEGGEETHHWGSPRFRRGSGLQLSLLGAARGSDWRAARNAGEVTRVLRRLWAPCPASHRPTWAAGVESGSTARCFESWRALSWSCLRG